MGKYVDGGFITVIRVERKCVGADVRSRNVIGIVVGGGEGFILGDVRYQNGLGAYGAVFKAVLFVQVIPRGTEGAVVGVGDLVEGPFDTVGGDI